MVLLQLSSLLPSSLLTLVLASTACRADTRVSSPVGRSVDDTLSMGPCGGVASGASGTTTALVGGADFVVEWQSTGNPSSDGQTVSFRMTYSVHDDSNFDLPQHTIATGLQEHTASDEVVHAWAQNITMPDLECPQCTLQIVEVVDGQDSYYSCADVSITGQQWTCVGPSPSELCYGNGECIGGLCFCDDGYTGVGCEDSTDPIKRIASDPIVQLIAYITVGIVAVGAVMMAVALRLKSDPEKTSKHKKPLKSALRKEESSAERRKRKSLALGSGGSTGKQVRLSIGSFGELTAPGKEPGGGSAGKDSRSTSFKTRSGAGSRGSRGSGGSSTDGGRYDRRGRARHGSRSGSRGKRPDGSSGGRSRGRSRNHSTGSDGRRDRASKADRRSRGNGGGDQVMMSGNRSGGHRRSGGRAYNTGNAAAAGDRRSVSRAVRSSGSRGSGGDGRPKHSSGRGDRDRRRDRKRQEVKQRLESSSGKRPDSQTMPPQLQQSEQPQDMEEKEGHSWEDLDVASPGAAAAEAEEEEDEQDLERVVAQVAAKEGVGVKFRATISSPIKDDAIH